MEKRYVGINGLRSAVMIAALMILGWFSFYLMFHTFSYNSEARGMVIASKAWSDFGAHIPLIRSFSEGPNFSRLLSGKPVESPLYPGEAIRYHYGFYAFVGLLEKLGIRIDWAFNIPSAVGFFALLIGIAVLSYRLFNDVSVSVMSVIFFLFNGSLTFLRFFREHPLSFNTLGDIVTNSKFVSFGPWDNGTITAFWNLNIYTNQRHLALSYALILVLLYLVLSSKARPWKTGLLGGVLLGILFFVNFAAAGIAVFLLGWFFLARKECRKSVVGTALFSILPFLILLRTANIHSGIVFDPGYLVHAPKHTASILTFWFDNLGLHLFLIPLGIILAPKSVRRLLLLPLMVLFAVPNLYRFSPDMINNHKFFNFFIILGGMFSAYAIRRVIGTMGTLREKTKGLLRAALLCLMISSCAFCLLFLTLSGIIDLFPVLNDYSGIVADTKENPDISYILHHTRPEDTVANSTWFYHPATLAGRAVFSGYTYFTWSYGYDDRTREAALVSLYRSQTIPELCSKLNRDGIAMVELDEHPETYLAPDMDFWGALSPSYENPQTHRKLYLRSDLCSTDL